MYTAYMISWSPSTGEATYTRGFNTADERETFIKRLGNARYHIWENQYTFSA